MPVKVELQVSVLINGRAIWIRSKTIASVLTATLSGADYDKVVEAAETELEELCRTAQAPKESKKPASKK
jgi:hypothetical protein